MWPVVAGAAIGAIGSMIASSSSAKAQAEANRVNREIAEAQMEFQERMSNTAHQREVVDLREAGLNPILSSKYGGASTPMGASTTVQPANMNPAGAGLLGASQGVGSALGWLQVAANIDKTKAEEKLITTQDEKMGGVDTALVRNQIQLSQAEERLKGLLGDLAAIDKGKRYEDINHVKAQIAEVLQNIELLRERVSLTKAETRGTGLRADISAEQLKGARIEGEIDESLYGRVLRYLDRTSTTAKSMSELGLKLPSFILGEIGGLGRGRVPRGTMRGLQMRPPGF